MSRLYEIEPMELEKVLRFINEDNAPFPEEAAGKLQNIFFGLQRKMMKNYSGLQRTNDRLTRRVDHLEEKKEEQLTGGEYSETGLDSLDVASALLGRLQALGTYRLTKNLVIYILYEMYCSWLRSKGQRLFMEHPVATEWGPQFWRVYKKLDIKVSQGDKALREIQERNPGVAAYIVNAANKYFDFPEKTLKEVFIKSKAYKKAAAAKNGVWNAEIKDIDIYNE